jgi:hypothetical protein
MPFCSIQDVGIDTLLVCDIIISHEPSPFISLRYFGNVALTQLITDWK